MQFVLKELALNKVFVRLLKLGSCYLHGADSGVVVRELRPIPDEHRLMRSDWEVFEKFGQP